MSRDAIRRRRVGAPPRAALSAAAALLATVSVAPLGACAQRQPAGPQMDAQTREALGLTADARDPAVRAREDGYNRRWKPAPEAEGTYDPLAPERRKVGGYSSDGDG